MSNVPQKFPELKGKVDPKVETELFMAFKRIYEYIDSLVTEKLNELEIKIKAGTVAPADFNDLIGIFSQPLAGSSVSDPLLQSVIQSFGAQLANKIFAGPSVGGAANPSFRALVVADIPAGVGITNVAGNNFITKSDGTNLVPSRTTDDGTVMLLVSRAGFMFDESSFVSSIGDWGLLGNGTYIAVDDNGQTIKLIGLPLLDPGVPGALWNNGGVINISP